MEARRRHRIARGIRRALLWLWLPLAHADAGVVEYDLIVEEREVAFTGRPVTAMTVNGGIPGPTLRFREGDVARIHVRNEMDFATSVHWHGVLLPPDQDGVPFVSFPGIAPRSEFTYEFPITHAGTYWYHSHTGLQEQRGVYGAIVIEPASPPSVTADREYVAVLSDWTDQSPERVLGALKAGNEYYAVRRHTTQHLFGAIARGRLSDFLRREWASMPENDISDVAFDRFLINGKEGALYEARPGETVRLRIVNAGASTYFHLGFAGGPMRIVAADGVDVEPIEVDRLLIALAETYDVLVTVPRSGRFELRASAQDGSGHASMYLGGGEESIPAPDVPGPDLYRNRMNMGYAASMWNTAWAVRGRTRVEPGAQPEVHDHGAHHGHGAPDPPEGGHAEPATAPAPDHAEHAGPAAHAGHGGHSMRPPDPERPLAPYERLRSLQPSGADPARPRREVVLHLTGDMDRYVWSLDGKTLTEQDTIAVARGEVVRFVLVNRTMMHHPMHLHGHFFRVVNGQGDHAPWKHTVDVPPMSSRTIEFEADLEKAWLFHCHVLYHMKSGMARVVEYEESADDPELVRWRPRLLHEPKYAFGSGSFMSHMTEGQAQLSNTRNIVSTDWEVEWDSGEYDVTGAYRRYLNRHLSLLAGVNAYDEDGADDVRGVFGLDVLLPLGVRSTLWAGTDASFRWTAEKELRLTNRLLASAETHYDTEIDWEWSAGGELILTSWLSAVGGYHSEYGAGGGLRIRLWSAGF